MLDSAAQFLFRHKISANAVTFLGLGLSLISVPFIVGDRFLTAAVILLLAGGCDLLDGKLARFYPEPDKFGALLDSSLDRYSDSFYYGGLLFYFLLAGEVGYGVLAFSACVAAFEISYIRARSEGLNTACQVGFWERGERTGTFILGLLFCNPHMVILLLGTLPHLTALRRLIQSRRRMLAGKEGEILEEEPLKNRRSKVYWVQAGLIILAVLLVRI